MVKQKRHATRAVFTIIKEPYSSEVSCRLCHITESKKTLNYVSDTNIVRKPDGKGPIFNQLLLRNWTVTH